MTLSTRLNHFLSIAPPLPLHKTECPPIAAVSNLIVETTTSKGINNVEGLNKQGVEL